MRPTHVVDRALARLRERGEAGSIMPMVPIMVLCLLAIAGLVIDASRLLNARGQAVAFAEEAARAGAQAIQVNAAGELELASADVPDLVADYCAHVVGREGVQRCALDAISGPPSGTPRPFTVETHVDVTIRTSLLGMVGVHTLSTSGAGRAQPRSSGDVGLPEVVPPTPLTP